MKYNLNQDEQESITSIDYEVRRLTYEIQELELKREKLLKIGDKLISMSNVYIGLKNQMPNNYSVQFIAEYYNNEFRLLSRNTPIDSRFIEVCNIIVLKCEYLRIPFKQGFYKIIYENNEIEFRELTIEFKEIG